MRCVEHVRSCNFSSGALRRVTACARATALLHICVVAGQERGRAGLQKEAWQPADLQATDDSGQCDWPQGGVARLLAYHQAMGRADPEPATAPPQPIR